MFPKSSDMPPTSPDKPPITVDNTQKRYFCAIIDTVSRGNQEIIRYTPNNKGHMAAAIRHSASSVSQLSFLLTGFTPNSKGHNRSVPVSISPSLPLFSAAVPCFGQLPFFFSAVLPPITEDIKADMLWEGINFTPNNKGHKTGTVLFSPLQCGTFLLFCRRKYLQYRGTYHAAGFSFYLQYRGTIPVSRFSSLVPCFHSSNTGNPESQPYLRIYGFILLIRFISGIVIFHASVMEAYFPENVVCLQ